MKKKILSIQTYDCKTETWALVHAPGKGKAIRIHKDGLQGEYKTQKIL